MLESNTKGLRGHQTVATPVTDGVLVLESKTRALVLPQVDDVNNIPNPGMMVFVRKEGSERLAVFNGSRWSFWKP